MYYCCWTTVSVRGFSHYKLPQLIQFTEWLVADLALASHCVPSITISSATLLHTTIDSHPPDAIIVQATFLEQLLEVLEESDHPHTHSTTVVVVGDRTGEVKKHKGNVKTKLVTWEDVETFKSDPLSSTPPSMNFFALCA